MPRRARVGRTPDRARDTAQATAPPQARVQRSEREAISPPESSKAVGSWQEVAKAGIHGNRGRPIDRLKPMASGIEPGIAAAVVGRCVDRAYRFQSPLGGARG